MSRLYIDLTTSIRWRRPPVGIVRVEREFAAYCLAHEPDSVFCELDDSGTYRVLSPARVREVLDERWCRAAPMSATTAEPFLPNAPVRGKVQKLADWAAAWAPRIVPAVVYPLLRDIGRVLLDHHHAYLRNRAARCAQHQAAAHPQGYRVDTSCEKGVINPSFGVIAPTSNDVFFSIGLQWHHGASHAYHLKQATGVRVVEACYDTIPIDFPEYAGSAKQPFAEYFTCLAHTADLVFAISDTSRSDLAAFYTRVGVLRIPPIRTIYLATPEVQRSRPVSELPPDERDALQQLDACGGYVLYVSTFEARKNHRLLLHVWKELHGQRGDACPTLVIVGMFGWGVNDLWAEMQATEVWAAGKIVLLHHVSDALLAHLYRNCLFTVFPSVYEGWGLAATESLAYGKLVITSDAPALREATQGLGPAINPFDYVRWRDEIVRFVDDPSLRTAAEARIRDKYVPRHWDDFSRELLAAALERA
jgi:glycosyltransferase involved in cell wall biosynthesis